MTDDTKFELPRHTTREDCNDDYEEEVMASGEVVRHDVVPSNPEDELTPPNSNDIMNFRDACKVQTHFNAEGRKVTEMKARKSAWTHNIIHLNGKKFDFTGRDYLMPIYDANDKEIILKTGRQVEKSTFLGNNLAILCSIQSYFKCLYVSPSHSQTRQFSNEKLKTVLEGSPLIRRYLQDSRVSNQVFEKSFTNGSFIFLRSAFLSADRARGISADMLCFDKDAEALTKDGWRKVSEVTKEDWVATRNPETEKIEWHQPYQIIKKKHTGKMVTFSHRGFHMRVTDNHKMVVNWRVKSSSRYKQEDKWVNEEALDLYNSKRMGFKMGLPIKYSKPSPEFFKYDGVKYDYNAFATLVGWYLAEGCMERKTTVLNINFEQAWPHIEPALKKLNLKYGICKHSHGSEIGKTIRISTTTNNLYEYFRKLGKAYTKYIPREFMSHPNALWCLLEGLYRGDGSTHKNQTWDQGTLRTRSKQMAYDVQEAWTICGRMSPVYVRMTVPAHQDNPNYKNIEKVELYEVAAHGRDYMIWWKTQTTGKITTEVVSEEEVYCVNVKNHQIIVKGNESSKGIVVHNCIDEFQDILISNVPVMAQCLSHSKHGYHLYTGTPKTFDNTIEIYWDTSSMTEWMVPCSGCSGASGRKWNFLDTKNIGTHGVICKYCGKPLDVTKGQWQNSKKSRLKGYRIPQLMVPWIAGSEDQWGKLVYNYENYPESQFYNEVLGLSYDNASKPITRADVLGNCSSSLHFVDPYNLSGTPKDAKLVHKMVLFAGVDWGEGNDGTGTDIMGKIKTASYTVLTIGGYVGDKKFRVVYMKRYVGKEVDPDFVVKDIIKICTNMNVKMIGTDWGHGWGVNNRLFRLYGPKRCAQFMYVDKQKEVRKWDPIGYKVQLMRNHVMSEIFYQFKEGKFLFPPLEEWEVFCKDMFNISVEYIEYSRTIRYVHRPSDPDDWFHSLLYCKQVGEMYYGKYTSQ